MKRWIWIGCIAAIIVGVLWYSRGLVRDGLADMRKPALPVAQPFATSTTPASVTSTAAKPPVKKPASSDPLAWSGELPKSVNLAVPFLSQAPKMVWDAIHEDACEEASIIMVDAYYRGKKTIDPSAGDQAILDLVALENKIFGYFESTTAAETVRLIREYFGYKRVTVYNLTGPDDIKRALANGYPVILPASGKTLQNPNFKNGGPVYHMLVVKGYLADGRWITNDPGTRKGADYIYDTQTLMDAAHDWNGGDVLNGDKVMIVIIPNTK
jgi:hypothetical protein